VLLEPRLTILVDLSFFNILVIYSLYYFVPLKSNLFAELDLSALPKL
jgi:hypothetical protein